jgi:polyisoprenoid-binding protein YceI
MMTTDTIKYNIRPGRGGPGRWVSPLLLLLCPLALGAESTVRFEPAPGQSPIQIDGTSNLHNWTIKGTVIQGYIDANETYPLNPQAPELSHLEQVMKSVKTHVEITVRSLKSGHSGMDKNTYKALKADQYPNILYDLEQISIRTWPQPPQMTATVDTTGRLSVAGATRQIHMPVTAELLGGGQFKLSGQIAVKMTDFGISPPTALLGVLKTGDEMTIRFAWTVERKTPLRQANAKVVLPYLQAENTSAGSELPKAKDALAGVESKTPLRQQPRHPASSAQRQAITKVVLSYLQAVNALAGSELPKAKDALAGVASAAKEFTLVQVAALPENEKQTWQQDVEHLHTNSAKAVDAAGLADVRLAFRQLSQATITLVRDFGYLSLPSNRPLFCYGGSSRDEQAKGKVWLQDTPTANSPYEPTVRSRGRILK